VRTPGTTEDRSGAKCGLWVLGTAENFSGNVSPAACSHTSAAVVVTNRYAYGMVPSAAGSLQGCTGDAATGAGAGSAARAGPAFAAMIRAAVAITAAATARVAEGPPLTRTREGARPGMGRP
jgi:hypothetical protein